MSAAIAEEPSRRTPRLILSVDMVSTAARTPQPLSRARGFATVPFGSSCSDQCVRARVENEIEPAHMTTIGLLWTRLRFGGAVNDLELTAGASPRHGRCDPTPAAVTLYKLKKL